MFNWLRYWLERRDYQLRDISRQISTIYQRELNTYGPNSNRIVTLNMSSADFGYLTGYLESVTGRDVMKERN